MKRINTKTLELTDLQDMLLHICTTLNRPVRKNQLIKMCTDLFECNTPKQVEFALLDLLEHGKLCQQDYFIIPPEFKAEWDGTVTATDEGIIKFLLILKEEIKADIYFNVYAKEPLTPHIFFKYIEMKYPALLHRSNPALAYMEQFENTFSHVLNNNFYAELNDYPTSRWMTTFFNNPDCRILIKNMDVNRNHVNIQILLLPGKKKSYKKANIDFEEFEQNVKDYFSSNVHIHVKKSLITIPFSKKRKKGA